MKLTRIVIHFMVVAVLWGSSSSESLGQSAHRRLDDRTWAGSILFPEKRLFEGMVLERGRDAENLENYILETMSSSYIPGLAACAIRDGETIWNGDFGYANFGTDYKVDSSTLFMLASVSKTVTGVALMQLWENGLFQLDDNVNASLPFQVIHPDFPDSAITFRMLLTHTSSIRDNWDYMPYYLGDSPIPLGEYLAGYFTPGGPYYDADANFNAWSPGSGFDYSNIAVALAGFAVEAITGMSFSEYCQDSLFAPLNMPHTNWFLAETDTSHVAIPYSWNGTSYDPYEHYGYSDYPSGQLRTSALQLGRFLTAFMGRGTLYGVSILDSATVEKMTTIQFPDLADDQGLIWYTAQLGGRTLWGHSGGDLGVTTEMWFCPEENSGVVVLTNGEAFFYSTIVHEIFEFAADYLFAMELSIDLLSSSTAQLSWVEVAGATHYDIFKSDTPYFSPTPLPWQSVEAPTTTLIIEDGIGQSEINYFYIGRARSPSQTSDPSNTVGDHDFSLPSYERRLDSWTAGRFSSPDSSLKRDGE